MGAGQLSLISAAMHLPGSQRCDSTPANLGTPRGVPMARVSHIPVLPAGVGALLSRTLRPGQRGSRSAAASSPLEVTMIDPFFCDRLMHAFTTAHATALSQAVAPACEATACRAPQEAEAILEAVQRRERMSPSDTNQVDDPAVDG